MRSGTLDLGPLPQLMWVDIFDQRDMAKPKQLPVPKLFQQGQEHNGRMTMDAVLRWLSRGLERNVTSVHIGTLTTTGDGRAWSLAAFRSDAVASPFVEGAAVVVCCDGEGLRPGVAAALPVKETKKEVMLRRIGTAADVGGDSFWQRLGLSPRLSGFSKLTATAVAAISPRRNGSVSDRTAPRSPRDRRLTPAFSASEGGLSVGCSEVEALARFNEDILAQKARLSEMQASSTASSDGRERSPAPSLDRTPRGAQEVRSSGGPKAEADSGAEPGMPRAPTAADTVALAEQAEAMAAVHAAVEAEKPAGAPRALEALGTASRAPALSMTPPASPKSPLSLGPWSFWLACSLPSTHCKCRHALGDYDGEGIAMVQKVM